MRDEFESLQAERICSETHSWGPLPRVCAPVRCSTAERSTLVRLVQRLRLMPAVHLLRWENRRYCHLTFLQWSSHALPVVAVGLRGYKMLHLALSGS